MRLTREWNLNWPLRLAIIGLSVAHLLFARPWMEHDPSKEIDAYTCSIATLVLAIVPKRTRLWVATCAALAVPLLTEIVIGALNLMPESTIRHARNTELTFKPFILRT